MQLLQLSLSLPLILSIFSPLTSTKDLNNDRSGFINESKAIVSFVRSDIEMLKNDLGAFNNAKMRENQIKVLQHFTNVSRQVEQIEKHYVTICKRMLYSSIGENFPQLYKINKIVGMLVQISENFDKMKEMQEYEIPTLISFTEAIAAPDGRRFGSNLMNEFFWQLFNIDNEYIDKFLLVNLANMRQQASQQQSPQQHIYSMYLDIALTELKVYILVEYSMMIRRVSGQGDSFNEWNKIRLNYKDNTEHGLILLKNLTQQADRILWRGDPAKHELKVTYDEVTRLLQGYVENEVDLNSDGSCSETCPDYQNTTSMGCFDQMFCSQQPKCSGRIHNCEFVESDLSVCQSPVNSNRRYEYIEYADRERFGNREKCWRDVNNVESWRRVFMKCSYCFCLCDEQGPKSDRYFNLRETLSDVKANKVVTGVRFVKKNRIFHLQIQQGELQHHGVIDNSTVEWKPVEDYKITDSNIMDGVDYHTLSYQSRAIDLDNVMKTDDITLVVTGVRFQVLDGHLNLKVHLSKFDFAKGELIEPEVNSIWQSNDNIYNRQKLRLDNLDVSTRYLDGSQRMSGDCQYVEFVNTGMAKDAAQTTVPFIDVQDAASIQPVPLAGIGIYYKGSHGYGGFVAPKIISYDLLPFLQLSATVIS
ncbi:hypothetical protein KR044_002304 [Drosophila immigrans]|nr:hypothetical protein KR044_002304 [Drosophila immigrans]